jgi:hypothetical protein
MTIQTSNCCGADLKTNTFTEGTGYYTCARCLRPCDPHTHNFQGTSGTYVCECGAKAVSVFTDTIKEVDRESEQKCCEKCQSKIRYGFDGDVKTGDWKCLNSSCPCHLPTSGQECCEKCFTGSFKGCYCLNLLCDCHQPLGTAAAIKSWLSDGQFGYVGETDNLDSVCLDGYFDLEDLAKRIVAAAKKQDSSTPLPTSGQDWDKDLNDIRNKLTIEEMLRLEESHEEALAKERKLGSYEGECIGFKDGYEAHVKETKVLLEIERKAGYEEGIRKAVEIVERKKLTYDTFADLRSTRNARYYNNALNDVLSTLNSKQQ